MFQLKEHHSIDNIGDILFERTRTDEKIGLSIDDKDFLKLMDNEFVKRPDGHWSAPLPFRDPRPQLPNNRPQAFKRAKILQSSLQKNEVKKKPFVDFMQTMFDNGHAEQAPHLQPSEECWYLPIFGVYHPKKKDKIRVVFDASAKYEGVSLNNVLISGPDLTNNLVGVLLRFRREPIAVVADIEQMFYGFYVEKRHRNFLRFIWHKDNDTSKELIEYRMCVHVFGNTPSPAVASYGLHKCVESADTDVKDFVERNFYVDDGLTSYATNEEAITVVRKTQSALQDNGKLRLHKIASNSDVAMKAFKSEDLAKELKDIDLKNDELPVQHSLSLSWDLNNDCFTYKLSGLDKPVTRRGVLSTVNSLFDPLGFISPVVIQGRVILRNIVSETIDWDQPLSENSEQMWKEWKHSLRPLEELNIPRSFIPASLSNCKEKQLHIFSDASEKAIASVAYVRTVDAFGKVNVGYVFGKSKVAPKHGHTIPRLELCSAVLADEIGQLLSEQLDISPQEIKYYTDSKVVLGYLNNKVRRFHVYVCNRVGKIRQFSKPEQWQYVSTDDNPADHGTRHVSAYDIQESTWLLGPSFLQKSEIHDENSERDFLLVNPQVDKELKPEIQTLKTNASKPNKLGTTRFSRFSKWKNLVETIMRLKHVVRKYQKIKSELAERNVTMYQEAEQFIIREVKMIFMKWKLTVLKERNQYRK